MKPNQLATLVLRLLGIYWLIQIIPTISLFSSIIFFTPYNTHDTFVPALLIACCAWVACCFIGVLLLVRSESWSEKLMPKDTSDANITAVSFEQVQILVFAVAGVLIFAGALPQLFTGIFYLVNLVSYKISPPADQSSYTLRQTLVVIGTLLKAALGLWLFFGAHGFANFWRSLRTFGTPKPT